jgi:hypothetical protein
MVVGEGGGGWCSMFYKTSSLPKFNLITSVAAGMKEGLVIDRSKD